MKLTSIQTKIACTKLLLGLLLFSSCNKYLDREPLSDVTPQQYLNTESDMASYTIARYQVFPSHANWGVGTFETTTTRITK